MVEFAIDLYQAVADLLNKWYQIKGPALRRDFKRKEEKRLDTKISTSNKRDKESNPLGIMLHVWIVPCTPVANDPLT